jgi:hypothetical protein
MASDATTTNMIAGGHTRGERRAAPDRRRHSWRTVTYCGLHGRGRRHQARRQDHSYYLDRYEYGLVFVGLLVMLLSCVDALLTLFLLDRGAYEVNYLMARLLDMGVRPFILAKIIITAAGVLFLLMHAHFRLLRVTSGKRMLQVLAAIYGLLIGWEAVLLGVVK